MQGIRLNLPFELPVQSNAVSKVTQVESGTTLRVNHPRLSAVIGDTVEVSDAAKWVSAAFEDLSKVDRLFYGVDALKAFTEDYTRRRNLIVEAGKDNESFGVKQAALLGALDAEMSKRVSRFADDSVALIVRISAKAAARDKELVASGWVEDYKGTEGLSLSKSEATGIKSDIEQVFAAVMKDAANSGGTQQTVVKGKYLGTEEFSGISLEIKILRVSSQIGGKHDNSRNMRVGTFETDDINSFAFDWFSQIAILKDTLNLDDFSGGLRDIFGRLDSAASVHNPYTERLLEKDDKAGQSMLKAADGLNEAVKSDGNKAFEKYVDRISGYARTLTDQQKTLLGVLYLDAEKMETEKALKKVDAFAGALANGDFMGFRFDSEGLNVKNFKLLHQLQWFKDDESTTGVVDPIFFKGLSLEERIAMLFRKYLPHKFERNEIHQRNLVSARAKLARIGDSEKDR